MVTPKMVAAGFRRSLSLTSSNPSRPSIHVRSESLPTRSHPLIPQLRAQISHLQAWASDWAQRGPRTSAHLCRGLAHLDEAHGLFADLLRLPQTQLSLRRRRDPLVEGLLEAFLSFVDAYGIFRSAVLSLKEDHSAAQVAIRKRDDAGMASRAKARRKIDKEMARLASEIRSAAGGIFRSDDGDGELAGVIGELIAATVTVSAAMFHGIAVSSSWGRLGCGVGLRLGRKRATGIRGEDGIEEFPQIWEGDLRKKGDEEIRLILNRMGDLEEWMGRIELGSERVFRSLINTRVSLLNILTN